MTFLDAMKISIIPALVTTIDIMVYAWAFYCLVKWAWLLWTQSDEEEEGAFDTIEEARCLSGTGEPRPISHTVEGFKKPYPSDYDPETDPSHYNIGALGSRDGEGK